MARNPYDILQINPLSSDEDLKKQYRNLCRKYHPDSNVNNPNKDKTDELFEEVQLAYKSIVSMREKGQDPYAKQRNAMQREQQKQKENYNNTNTTGEQPTRNNRTTETEKAAYSDYKNKEQYADVSPNDIKKASRKKKKDLEQTSRDAYIELQVAGNLIYSQQYKKGLDTLMNILDIYRNDEWYHLAAIASFNLKKYKDAKLAILKALEMNPQNIDYKLLLQEINAEDFRAYSTTHAKGYTPPYKIIIRFLALTGFIILFVLFGLFPKF